MLAASSYGALRMQPRERTRVLTLRFTGAELAALSLPGGGECPLLELAWAELARLAGWTG